MSLEEFDVDLFGTEENTEVCGVEAGEIVPDIFETETQVAVEETPTVVEELVTPSPQPTTETESETEFNHLDEETQNLLLAIGRVGIEMRKIKARQKRLKGELEDLMEQLQYCGLDSEEKENEESSTSTSMCTQATAKITPTVEVDSQQQQEPSYQDSKAEIAESEWRSVPIEKLVDIASSTIEKLKEANVDTLGELEDLRAKISNGKAEWPKGIGPKKVDAIENAVIDWFTKHPVAGEDCETVSTEENVSETPEFSSLLENKAYWESGNEAYGRGDDVTDCPYVPGEEQEEWIRGWRSAERADQLIENL